MAATKIKRMRTINVNVVQGSSYEKFSTQKFVIIMKVSLHENFQIYFIFLYSLAWAQVYAELYS